ncbi:MAG: peptidoglycan DD-metalloendopeptidase family protein [Paludibacteraceae bacterium]|nr:peptidoglycan DD-metalloendopeptidase family protein [Paludibacteraceae bacterium]
MKRLRVILMGCAMALLPLYVIAQDIEVMETDSLSEGDETLDEDVSGTISMDSASVKSFTSLSLPVDSLSDSLVVAIYRSGWDSTRVNPYHFPIDSIKDTFVVDCRGFYPPNINVVTSECGERWGRFHAGTDMRLAIGDSIHAAFDGKVRITRVGARKKGYGYFVLIQHPNGLETLYAHMSKILVHNNQDVKAGDVIGLGGNTGRSTGPHLHFEFRFLGNPINTRNLLEITPDTMYMKADTYTVSKKESFKEFYNYLHSPAQYYKIRQGDNLGRIARRYHTTVSRLCKLNHIKSTTILRVGRRLRVR